MLKLKLLYLYCLEQLITVTKFIGAQALSLAYFGQGTGQILLDNVECTGSESRLIECTANQIAAHNCIHLEDASVRCRAPESMLY